MAVWIMPRLLPEPLIVTLLLASSVTVLAPALAGRTTVPKARPWVALTVTGARISTLAGAVAVIGHWAVEARIDRAVLKS